MSLHSHSQGIIDVYRYALSQVQLYGPTNFSPFLDKTIEMAIGGVTQESQNYTILLVITVSSSAHQYPANGIYMYLYTICTNTGVTWL